jgi:hypothetical protein
MRLHLVGLGLSAFFIPAASMANWENVTTRTVQETILNSAQTATFRRESLNAVSGLAVSANAPLIQQGQWNSSVTFSPTTPGGAFSLLLHRHPADPEPPNGYDALSSPSSSHSITSSTNQLQGIMTPTGELRAGSGSRASEVNLTATHTLSVF